MSYWRVCSRLTGAEDGERDGNAHGQTVNYPVEALRTIPGVQEHHKEDAREHQVGRTTRAGVKKYDIRLMNGLTDDRKSALVSLETYNNVYHAPEGVDTELASADTRNPIFGGGGGSKFVMRDADPSVDTQPVTPTALPNDGYFICASTAVVAASTNNALILGGNEVGARAALDQFLDGLFSGVLALSTVPDTVGKPLLDDTSDFPDDLFLWFNAVLSANTILVRGVSNSPTPVTAFEIRITSPWELQFTTEAFLADPPMTPLPDMPFGFLALTSVLYLGLDLSSVNTTLQTTDLGSVLTFIGMDEVLLQALGSAIPLNLDRTSGSRNAMWFTTDPQYQSIMRLQFTLADETSFRSFINSISSGLTITNLKLIVRNRISQIAFVDGFEARHTPQLIVTLTVNPQGLTPMDAVFVFEFNVITLVIKPKDGSLEEMLGWLAFLTPGANADDVKSVKDWVATVSPKGTVTIREMRLAIGDSAIQSFYLDLEVDVDFGKSPDGSGKVAFFVSYRWKLQTRLRLTL
jgi:hypothetical protein